MDTNTSKRSGPLPDTGLGRMLLISFVLHLAVAALFSGAFFTTSHRQLVQVIEIDLSMLPVADPQAGRPDGSREPRPAAAAPARPAPRPAPPPPPAPRPEPAPAPPPAPSVPAPEPKPEPAPRPEPKPEPKPAPKPEPAPAPPPAPRPAPAEPPPRAQATAPPADEAAVSDAIERMRRQREREELRERLAALAAADTRGSNIPLGIETGTGTQAGVDQRTWIQAYLKENWNLSGYQVGGRRDLRAKVRIIYDAQGTLLDYTFTEQSREVVFDDSVRRAILGARQLPFRPERRLEIDVEFNLKDLLD